MSPDITKLLEQPDVQKVFAAAVERRATAIAQAWWQQRYGPQLAKLQADIAKLEADTQAAVAALKTVAVPFRDRVNEVSAAITKVQQALALAVRPSVAIHGTPITKTIGGVRASATDPAGLDPELVDRLTKALPADEREKLTTEIIKQLHGGTVH